MTAKEYLVQEGLFDKYQNQHIILFEDGRQICLTKLIEDYIKACAKAASQAKQL